MAPPWRSSTKSITRIPTTSSGKPRAAIPGYTRPSPPTGLHFHPVALFTSMAVCAAMRRVPPRVSAALITGSTALLEVLVDDVGTPFSLLQDLDTLADFERTGVAGRLGGGFTDLCMTYMGYAWRDLSSQLMHASGPLGDFIYDGPPTGGHGVVIAEAKGTCARAVAQSDVSRTADQGYLTQVDPHIGGHSSAGSIFHGYAVCLGAAPGGGTSFGHIAETPVTAPVAGQGGRTGQVNAGVARVKASLVFGNYRAAFMLANAPTVYDLLDRLTGGPGLGLARLEQTFARRKIGERWYLSGADPIFRHAAAPTWPPGFMLAEEVAKPLLDQLAAVLRSGMPPATLQLEFQIPTLRRIFSSFDLEGRPLECAVFPDGLTYALDPPPWDEARTWSVEGGLGEPVPAPTDPPDVVG